MGGALVANTPQCRVCGRIDMEPLIGWRAAWINNRGQFCCSADLADSPNPRTAIPRVDLAWACGQTHALVLHERYLERGTFAPADHNPPTPAPHDELTEAHRHAL
jgi:hypothetical protein